ncbi:MULTISPECIES: HlyD family secretion protein [Sphingomonas]|jgi:membrane fusion protein (multidrug efflux system)|uniref:Multidrug ABC transporter permease n=1 Tax=Sphingomonas hankookensis TaxID=563996 RepID=A0ABR5YB54_9SPHN|nr:MULTISPECIES: HlyD family secretion protein [Sphingomonas]KZE11510.1 multidrug ABC transporter permease [Sphingomonas hankookensis]PZT94103.1 MAG: HlyD family secretion protein [Sphingomonas sp.]RSV30848.1 HlyD family secretion protein [Sphingomonas sp. ABOLH]WCP72245.1 HlyD family secretion protein [Sphingomonas hankookensis]
MSDQQHDNQPADEATEAKRGNGRAKWILIALVVVAAVVGGWWYIDYQNNGKFFEETNDATVQADMVTIAPKVSGYVEEVLVRDNQDVTAGQPLVRIDPRDTRARAAQAEAQIAVAGAQADTARAQITEQYAAIDQARAQLAAARSKAAYDAGEVARYRPLAASGAETRQTLAQLEVTARQSADNVRAAEAAVAAQQRRVASLQSQVAQGRAQGQAARAQLAAASVDVGATQLTAPIAGRIGDKTVTIGQFVQAGTRLMSVVPLDRLYITANFKETQLALMRPGQPVEIDVDALDGVHIKGRVESIAPGTGAQFSLLPPQNATGNFTKITQRVPVRVSIEATPEARRLLVPGLSVTVTVDTRSARDELKQLREQAGR